MVLQIVTSNTKVCHVFLLVIRHFVTAAIIAPIEIKTFRSRLCILHDYVKIHLLHIRVDCKRSLVIFTSETDIVQEGSGGEGWPLEHITYNTLTTNNSCKLILTTSIHAIMLAFIATL
jgi:hypothetical protein